MATGPRMQHGPNSAAAPDATMMRASRIDARSRSRSRSPSAASSNSGSPVSRRTADASAVDAHRGKVRRDETAIPPAAGLPPLFRRREAIEIQLRAHVTRRTIGERVDPDQTERGAISLEELQQQLG